MALHLVTTTTTKPWVKESEAADRHETGPGSRQRGGIELALNDGSVRLSYPHTLFYVHMHAPNVAIF